MKQEETPGTIVFFWIFMVACAVATVYLAKTP